MLIAIFVVLAVLGSIFEWMESSRSASASHHGNNNAVVIKNIEFADLSTSTSTTQIHNPEDSAAIEEEINEVIVEDPKHENSDAPRGGCWFVCMNKQSAFMEVYSFP